MILHEQQLVEALEKIRVQGQNGPLTTLASLTHAEIEKILYTIDQEARRLIVLRTDADLKQKEAEIATELKPLTEFPLGTHIAWGRTDVPNGAKIGVAGHDYLPSVSDYSHYDVIVVGGKVIKNRYANAPKEENKPVHNFTIDARGGDPAKVAEWVSKYLKKVPGNDCDSMWIMNRTLATGGILGDKARVEELFPKLSSNDADVDDIVTSYKVPTSDVSFKEEFEKATSFNALPSDPYFNEKLTSLGIDTGSDDKYFYIFVDDENGGQWFVEGDDLDEEEEDEYELDEDESPFVVSVEDNGVVLLEDVECDYIKALNADEVAVLMDKLSWALDCVFAANDRVPF